jgi:hypothetical protein
MYLDPGGPKTYGSDGSESRIHNTGIFSRILTPNKEKRRILPYFVNLFFSFSGKPKHVLLLTTTNPILGRTVDDGKEKPAIVMFYNYTMGKSGSDLITV